MAFSTMIRSDSAPHTEGYGNTRDSLTATDNRISENNIAEGDYVRKIKDILGFQDRDAVNRMLDNFRAEYLRNFEHGSPGYDAAKRRLDTMITAATYGRPKKWYGPYRQGKQGKKKAA